jgi:hypothetical protein
MIARFKRAMVWLVLLSLVVAAIAVILVARGDNQIHIHMLIATGLGVALTMLLGTGLMVLSFLSAQSGHDDAVSHYKEDE